MPSRSRRQFIQEGGCLVIGFASGSTSEWLQGATDLPGSLSDHPALDSWLEIHSDGTVTVLSGKIEMGQGIRTALAQIAAEELDLPMEAVEVVAGDTSRTPDEGGTGGSRSVKNSGSAIRAAAAEARHLLIEMAGKRLELPAKDLVTEGGSIHPRGKPEPSLSYGQLFGGPAVREGGDRNSGPQRPQPVRAGGGDPSPGWNLPDKFTGQAAYIQDLRLPGMLHARAVRPPGPEARLVKVDAAAGRESPGRGQGGP